MKTKWPKVACRSFSHLRTIISEHGNHCAASKNSTLAILLLYVLRVCCMCVCVCLCGARARTHILQCAICALDNSCRGLIIIDSIGEGLETAHVSYTFVRRLERALREVANWLLIGL